MTSHLPDFKLWLQSNMPLVLTNIFLHLFMLDTMTLLNGAGWGERSECLETCQGGERTIRWSGGRVHRPYGLSKRFLDFTLNIIGTVVEIYLEGKKLTRLPLTPSLPTHLCHFITPYYPHLSWFITTVVLRDMDMGYYVCPVYIVGEYVISQITYSGVKI